MFDRWLIVENSLRNVISETGYIEGFEFQIRIPYYRGVFLSMIDRITVKAQNQTFNDEDIRFTVESGSFMLKEMETVGTLRWNFDEAATLKVYKPGGLPSWSVNATIEVEIGVRPAYVRFNGFCRKVLPLGPEKRLVSQA